MKALAHKGFTEASGLRLIDMPLPEPSAGEVLVRVAAASPNPIDWHLYRGDPLILRLRNPRFAGPRIVGEDFAGTVAAVGEDVTDYHLGQRVFGTLPAGSKTGGSFAQFLTAPLTQLSPLPDSVTFAQGATVGLAGLTALQAIRDVGRIEARQRVLIWGGAGGVGHLAIQIASLMGASQVDTVCSTRNIAMARSLGADTIYDYTRNEIPTGPYDLIIDTVSTANMRTIKSILSPGGTVVSIGAVGGNDLLGPLAPLAWRRIAGLFTGVRASTLLTDVTSDDLAVLGDWMGSGKLRVHIEDSFPLAQAKDALVTLEKGKVRGKLVVTIDQEEG